MSSNLEKDDEANNEDGSVWTSYSDMFTTMAIIFLVMFVFALLRSGVNTLETLQEKKKREDLLKGNLPEEIVKSQEKQKEDLGKSIEEMDQYQEMIDQKMLELNKFSQKMRGHKNVIKDLLKNQKVTASVIESLKKENQDFLHKKTSPKLTF